MRWSDGAADRAMLGLPLETVFGWRMHWRPGCEIDRKPDDPPIMKTARNFFAQAHGAEMLPIEHRMRQGACDRLPRSSCVPDRG
jgi:hypothetical protein